MAAGEGDYTIDNHGTLFVFMLLNDAAKAWVAENVDIGDHMQLGTEGFAVEHRFVAPIVEGLCEAGFLPFDHGRPS